MSMLLQTALIAAAAVLAVPVLVLLLQTMVALPRLRRSGTAQGPRPRVAVLVPAHNEQAAIGPTLESIGRQLCNLDRLVVIADNCSDNSAGIARQHGAEVSVRVDPVRRGKGYALDHGLHFLDQSGPPQIVIFVDADCDVHPGCIDRLARTSFGTGRPVQGAYLMNRPSAPQKTASMVSFAWKVKDFVRPLGWRRLGLPCQLAGSGMAIPWNVIRSTSVASGELAEDLKLGLDLALKGHYPLFQPDAVVTSDVAIGGKPSGAQRARWEHGALELLLRYLPRLLVQFCKAPSARLLAVALDLSVPPLALLALGLGAELVLGLCVWLAYGMSGPVLAAAGICMLFLVAIIAAWWGHGRDMIPLRWLIFAPIYAIGKIPLYGKFFLARQRIWARGERQP